MLRSLEPQIEPIEYLLVFLFIVNCGFSSANLIPFKNYLIILMGGFLLLRKGGHHLDGVKILIVIIISCLTIKVYHRGAPTQFLNIFILNSIAGFIAFSALRDKFRYAFFKIMYILALISLFGFGIFFLTGYAIDIPFLDENNTYKGFFLYAIRTNEIERIRNCGPFWEPGAYAGYIILTFLLFYEDLSTLYSKYKNECRILIIALITTFSTQGYAIAFIFIITLLIRRISRIILIKTFVKASVVVIVMLLVASSVPFLRDKIVEQYTLSTSWKDEKSLLSANRFSTTMLDLYNISKSPFWGNSENKQRLYGEFSTITYMISGKGSGVYASGSGTTMFIAQYGLILFVIYFYTCYKSLRKYFREKRSTIFVIIILLALGQCEIYLYKIMYISLPYLFLTATKKIKLNKNIRK